MGRTRCWTPGARGRVPPPPSDDEIRRSQVLDAAIHDSALRDRGRSALWRTLRESAALLGVLTWCMGGWRWRALAFALLVAGPLAGLLLHRLALKGIVCGVVGAAAFAMCTPSDYGYGPRAWIGIGGPLAAIAFAVYGVVRARRDAHSWL